MNCPFAGAPQKKVWGLYRLNVELFHANYLSDYSMFYCGTSRKVDNN